jgi:hypothetical protein
LAEVLALSLSPNTTSNSTIKALKSCRRGDDVSKMGANHAVAVSVNRVPTNKVDPSIGVGLLKGCSLDYLLL